MKWVSDHLTNQLSLSAMMVIFICQLDWAIGCPGIWWTIILGVSVRVFLDEISIWICRSKADCPSHCACSVAQLCLTLYDHMDCSLPGSSVHGIFQARILEWIAISSFRDLPEPEFYHKSPATQADSLLQSTFLMLLNFLVFKKVFIVCFCLSYYAKFSISHFFQI